MGQPLRSRPRPAPPTGTATEGQPPRQKPIWREYAEALAIAVVLAVSIRTFFMGAYEIPSGSMQPTLLIGDHILVNKLLYGLRMPDSIFGLHPPGIPTARYLFHLEAVHRGDVVVFVYPVDRSKDFIKRVIAVGGDTVEVRGGTVYLNGSRMADPHAHYQIEAQARGQSPRDNFGPLKIPPGKLFMMGDNRDLSFDSRFWGLVDANDVEGRALVIYWSWDSDSNSLLSVRWNREGKLVD